MQLTLVIGDASRELEVEPGTSVLRALQDVGVPMEAACGGNGTCGKCRVLVRSAVELSYRLACRTIVENGMVVFAEQASRMMHISESGAASPYAPDGGEEGSIGLAFDIGTTTVVCHVHRLSDGARLATASAPNPQSVFGADVISRIAASVEGRLNAMRGAIVSCMGDLAHRALEAAGFGSDVPRIERAVVAGNTVMEHIACNLPPDSIGASPFEPLSLFGDEHAFPEPVGGAYVMPCIAGYVGGDITAGLVAAGFPERERPALLIDVGTNGEMVIGCGARMVACATAAGPAFEGANIAFGMPAFPGAISHVEAVQGRLELDVIGGGRPVGICGSGLVDALAALLDLGVIDETGRILDPDEIEGWVAGLVVEADGANAVLISGNEGIVLTQRDVRNIQLAKAAVCAGVLTLLDDYGIGIDEVDELLVAGGFGSHIDVSAAARIGLFPSGLAQRARSIGNAAGEGASAVLVSSEARSALSRVVEACGYLELSTSPEFNEHYVDCMGFE